MVACLTLVKRHENAERDEREIHATTHVFENANHISINDTSDSDSETVLSTELKEAIISQEEPSVDFVQCFPRHIRLEKPVITLGRNKEECDVIISSPGIFQNRISRKHAILSLNEALRQWSIKDCGSVNGTFVNGSKIGPDGSVLVNDDIVQFGGSAIETFEYCFHTDCVSANSTRSSRLHRQQPEEIGTEGESNPVTSMSPQHDSLSNATNSEASGAISVDYSSQSAEDSSGHSSIRGNSSSSSSSSGSNINNRALHRVVERDRMTRAVEGLGILSSACPVARQKRSRSGQEPEKNKNKPIIELEMAKAKRNKLRNRTKIGEGDDHENVQEQKEERNNTLKTMMSDLRSELTCPICTELYQKTLTLDCGHSFCSDCIEKWLRESLTCPLCRTCLSKPPVLSHALDRSVQIIIEDDEAEKVAFLKRKAASDTVYKACLDKKNKLEGQLSEARRMGYRLCHIAHVWSRHEQFRFLQGIATFHGLSRQAYCDSVSLCEELVDRVSEDELAVFAYNLMLQRNTGTDPPSESETEEEKNLSYYVNWARKDVVELRSRILMFIKYG